MMNLVVLSLFGVAATAFSVGPHRSAIHGGLHPPPISRAAPSARRRQPPLLAASLSPSVDGHVDNVGVILLAGGVGKRMNADRPKQFLELMGKPVLEHSVELFLTLPGVKHIVLVLDEAYRDTFRGRDERIVFAPPGEERQDSVWNGLQAMPEGVSVVCIHDSARPLVTQGTVLQCIRDANTHGAAVVGVPMKATVKESEDGQFVLRTIERSRLWEIQTPQVIQPALLKEGFALVREKSLAVTDDVSLVELLGKPVKLTMGEYENLKITTPEDMVIAEQFMRARQREETAAEHVPSR